jgi:hypothetical protein
MVFPLIASGYRALLNYKVETSYGTAPTSTAYNWYGAVQSWTATEDKKAFLVYRSDGSIASRYPSYILQGTREIDVEVKYYPQDINVLTDMINNVTGDATTSPKSHTLLFKHFDIQQQGSGTIGEYYATGAVADRITIAGRTGMPLEVTINYMCQDFFESLPSGATFTSVDPGTVPFFFKNESLSVGGGVLARTLEFNETITNNVKRVAQFGQYFIRAEPVQIARAQGTFRVTFQSTDGAMNIDDLAFVLSDSDSTGLTPKTIILKLGDVGGLRTLTHTTAKIHTAQVPNTISDYTALQFTYDAQDATVA